jgi:DNA-binding Xre family transcriptional regulator
MSVKVVKYYIRGIATMEEVLERLQTCVNREIATNNYTIKGFSVRCGISYEEMRLITNGKIKDVRLSTIYQICSNSNIDMMDIFNRNDIENIFNQITLSCNNTRYGIKLLKYR